jgi:hypothetical protein
MIKKPQGYEEAQAFTGEYESLPADGYVCRIVSAKEDKSSTGKPMLKLALDIREGAYKDFFKKRFEKDTRDEKKWGCTYYQMLTNESAGFLKGLIEDIEKSNFFKWDWDENKLKGKLVGMIFQREEYERSNGETGWFTKPVSPRSIQTIREGDFKIPEDKPIVIANNTYTPPKDFEPIEGEDEDLPF